MTIITTASLDDVVITSTSVCPVPIIPVLLDHRTVRQILDLVFEGLHGLWRIACHRLLEIHDRSSVHVLVCGNIFAMQRLGVHER